MRPDSELQVLVTEEPVTLSGPLMPLEEAESSGQLQMELFNHNLERSRFLSCYSLFIVLFLTSGLPAFGLLWLFNVWHIGSILNLTATSQQVFLLLYIYSSGTGLLIFLPLLCVTATKTLLTPRGFSLQISEVGIRRISYNHVNERSSRFIFSKVSAFVAALRLCPREVVFDWLCIVFGFCPTKAPVVWSSVYRAAILNRWYEDFVEVRVKGGKRFVIPLAGLSTNQRRQIVRSLRRWLGVRVVGELYADKEEFKPIKKIKKKSRFGWLSRLGFTDLWFSQISDRSRSNLSDILEPGTWLQDKTIRIVDTIATGGLANIYIAEEFSLDSIDGENIVLKEFILSTDGNERENLSLIPFQNELIVLNKLDNEFMVRGLGELIEDHRAFIKLEYIKGVTIQEHVSSRGKMPEAQVVELAKIMCKMLIYLGSINVVHRDFTPHNLILTENLGLKLIDFNASLHAYRKADERDDVVGKPDYIPPEQFRGRATSQSDIYALGATLYFMLTGEPPEPISQSSPKTLTRYLSDEINEIVRKATAPNLSERYADADVLLADLLMIQQDPASEEGLAGSD